MSSQYESVSVYHEQTAGIAVANAAALALKIANDLDYEQFIREFTMNGIEAVIYRCMVHDGFGNRTPMIRWAQSHSPILKALGIPESAPKLCCMDNGIGMGPKQIDERMRNLTLSEDKPDSGRNFGVGARISGLRASPSGVIIESWQEGRGYVAMLWHDIESGEVGLRSLNTDPEITAPHLQNVIPISSLIDGEGMPDLISKSGGFGSRFTFVGPRWDANTLEHPEIGAGRGAAHWICAYLNKKFYRVPDSVVIHALAGSAPSSHSATILGNQHGLDGFCSRHGSVALSDAVVHWWVVDESPTNTSDNRSRYLIPGGALGCHSAIIYDDEIYDLSHSGDRVRLFGVRLGWHRVAIYVEPQSKHLSPTIQRGGILFRGKTELPWKRWGDEFKAQMPAALQEYIDSASSALRDRDDDDDDKYFRSCQELLSADDASRTKRRKGGEPICGKTHPPDTHGDGIGQGPCERSSGGCRPPKPAIRGQGDDSGVTVKGGRTPRVRFAWTKEQAADAGCGDCPAVYDPELHTAYINFTFPCLSRQFDLVLEQFALDSEEDHEIVMSIFEREWARQLKGFIINNLKLRAIQRWSPDRYRGRINPESIASLFTFAPLVRQRINQLIGQKLGSKKGE